MISIRWLVEILDRLGVPFRERFYEGEGLVRHYYMPQGWTLEVVLR